MELVKQSWNINDIIQLDKLLKSKVVNEKIDWTKNIVNTKMDVLAIPTKELDFIVKEISKGDIVSFINCYCDHKIQFTYHEDTIIFAKLITKVADFEIFKKAIIYFANIIDNWASCDAINGRLKFAQNAIFNLSEELICSDKEFVKRVGFRLLFSIINDDFIDDIFNLIKVKENEKEYYVNMIIAWLIAECFIKQREKTLEFMKTYKNRFALNKAISKCHDSFRVVYKDKVMLKTLRIN